VITMSTIQNPGIALPTSIILTAGCYGRRNVRYSVMNRGWPSM